MAQLQTHYIQVELSRAVRNGQSCDIPEVDVAMIEEMVQQLLGDDFSEWVVEASVSQTGEPEHD